jgi:hypothetical protein
MAIQYPLWYWSSNENPFLEIEDDKWAAYNDVDNEIIEKAFLDKIERVELDSYIIDLSHLIQISKINGYHQRPLKRITETSKLQCYLSERFYLNDVIPIKSIGGIHWHMSRFVREWTYQFKSVCLQQTLSADTYFFPRGRRRGFIISPAWFVPEIINNPRKEYKFSDDPSLLTDIMKSSAPSAVHETFPELCTESGYDCQSLQEELTKTLPRPCRDCRERMSLASISTTPSIRKLKLIEEPINHFFLLLTDEDCLQAKHWKVNLLSKSFIPHHIKIQRLRLRQLQKRKRKSSALLSTDTSGTISTVSNDISPISDNWCETEMESENTMKNDDAAINTDSKHICEDVSQMSTEDYMERVRKRLGSDSPVPRAELGSQPWWFVPGGAEPMYQYFYFTSTTPYRDSERCKIEGSSLYKKVYQPSYGDTWMNNYGRNAIAPCSFPINLGKESDFELYSFERPFLRLELNDSSYPSCSNILWVAYKNESDDILYSELLQCGRQLSHETNTPLVCVTDSCRMIARYNGDAMNGYQKANPWHITEEYRQYWLKYVVDLACAGILEEGNLQDKTITARLLVNHLQLALEYDQLWSQCVYLYTRDSFLWRCVNRALIGEDIAKLRTLGPLCYLLHWSLSSFSSETTFTGIAYRGMNLHPQTIKQYEGSLNAYRSWLGFSSATKSRPVAEIMGNTIFIIDIRNGYGCRDVSSISQYPEEEEVLISAGAIFQIAGVAFDETTNKNIIHIKISDISVIQPTEKESGRIRPSPGVSRSRLD